MKPLPPTLGKNGFTYTKVLEGSRSYIYEQRGPENREGYEVFLKKVRPERQIFNKTLPAGERFPHNEAFGKWAWSFYSLTKATAKFIEIETKKA